MRSRFVVILGFLGCLWALMIARAAWLQILPNARLASLERRQFETVVELRSRRGDVLDRNGRELAVSVSAWSLYADPKKVKEPRALARELAPLLGQPAKALLSKLKGKQKRFIWIQRGLDQAARDEIEGALGPLQARGLGFLEESRRVYPNDRLLSHALGFVGSEGSGLEGLEARFEDELQGAHKRMSMRKDARGRPLVLNGRLFSEAPSGSDLILTIDRELQFTLEQELLAAAEAHRAESASGVVLDAQTSEILAIASVPSFDPNRPLRFPAEARRNRAAADAFEPGSVMKPFVAAAALERKLVEPNTKFDCQGGLMRVGNRTVREADEKHKFESLTVSEILAFSSNVGAAKIGLALGAPALREALEGFGFGSRTGVDLPGEAKGALLPLPWRDHLLATVSFGHGVSATALQVVNAYAAIANGGWLKRPYLVKGVRDHDTGEVAETKPLTIRRAISEEHVAKLRLMLMGTTAAGATGWNARVPGFPVAGKTGTAQKVDPKGRGYLKGAYISSFAGFLPAHDPKFVIFVSVNDPKKDYYGSQVAAPIFGRVAKFAVRRAGLAPVLISGEDVVPRSREERGPTAARPSFAAFEDRSPPALGVPFATTVRLPESAEAQAPAKAAREGDPGKAHEGAAAAVTGAGEAWEIMPDLSGLSVREILARTAGAEVALQIRGRGYAFKTSPPAGARLDQSGQGRGARQITVYLSNEDASQASSRQ